MRTTLPCNIAKNDEGCNLLVGFNLLEGPMIFIGYFTVGERVRFFFTSCVKQTNERSE